MSRPGPIHEHPHPLRGKRVAVKGHKGEFGLMDWFDRELQQTWQELRDYNRVATGYSSRRHLKKLPKDNEVVVVTSPMGGILAAHNTEIEEIPT